MKKSYQHIIKKSYTTPKIEEVEIDREMSLVMVTTPPTEGEEGKDEDGDGFPDDPYSGAQSINYGSKTYQSPSSPFGDTSEPRY